MTSEQKKEVLKIQEKLIEIVEFTEANLGGLKFDFTMSFVFHHHEWGKDLWQFAGNVPHEDVPRFLDFARRQSIKVCNEGNLREVETTKS